MGGEEWKKPTRHPDQVRKPHLDHLFILKYFSSVPQRFLYCVKDTAYPYFALEETEAEAG